MLFHIKLISVNVSVKTPGCDSWFLNLFIVDQEKARGWFLTQEHIPPVCEGFVFITAINISEI